MKTWNPSELEDGLLDYLYDELDPDERRSFELALEARPDLAAELERHRFVRSAARGLAPIPVPTVALQNVLAAADAEAERRRHAGAAGGAGFWARVRGWVQHPAFATASVALLVAGVGLTMSQRGVGGAGESGNEQRVPARVREAVAVRDAQAAATPVATEAEKRDRADEGQAAGFKAVSDPAALAENRPTTEHAELAAAPAPPAMARNAGAAGTAVPPRPEAGAGADSVKPRADLANDRNGVNEATAERGTVAGGAELPKKAADDAEVAGLAGDADVVAAKDGLLAADAKGKNRDEGARSKAPAAPEAFAKLDSVAKQNEPANGPARVADRPAPRVESSGNDAKQPAPVQHADPAEAKPDDRMKVAVQPTETENQGRTPLNAPRAADSNEVAKSPTRLWTTYGQQMAAGAWSDAAKTLGEIEKLGTETERVNQARAELKKRAQVATEPAKENASKLPDPGLKPGGDTKPNKP